jgi:hypothetical protein
MVITNQVIVTLLGLLLLTVIFYFILGLSKKPQNKGKEIGLIIGELMVMFPMSWFLFFILVFTIAEGLLAGGFATQDVAPISRIMMHTGMGLLSVFTGMIWVKEFVNFGQALGALDFKAAIPRFFTSGITFFLTFLTPVLNLIVIAGNLKQADHLALFFARFANFFALRSTRSYHAEVYARGFDVNTYSPIWDMDPVMLASTGGVTVHILLIFYEALKIISSRKESTRDALNRDMSEDPKTDQTDPKGNQADPKPEKSKPGKDEPIANTLKKVFKFLNLTDDDVNAKIASGEKLIRSYAADDAIQVAIGKSLGELILDIEAWKSKGKDKDERAKLTSKVLETLKKGPRAGGLGMTINPPKN